VTQIDLQADLDDRVSLGAFGELWWAAERTGSDDTKEFRDKKQAAIRMLRRNHPGFPASVTASGRTHLFRLGDLAEWAVGAQKSPMSPEEAVRHRSALVGVEWHLDRAIDAWVTELGPYRARHLAPLIAMALDQAAVAPGLSKLPARVRTLLEDGSGLSRLLHGLTARRAGSPPGLADAINVLSDGLPASAEGTARLARAMVASILAGQSAADVADHTLERCQSGDSEASQRRTAESLSMLMLAAGRPQPGEHIVDLAAGEAGLLIRAAGEAAGAVELTGIEVDPVTWAIGRCRLHLHGLAADFRLGDSLTDLESLPTGDLVLVDPPVDKRRHYVRWLTAAISACLEDSRAVVTVPALAAERGRREWREVGIRHCTFLVKCPDRLRLDRGTRLAIWGLEQSPRENLLVVDASRLGTERVALRDISADEAKSLHDLLDRWQRTGRVNPVSPLEANGIPRLAYAGLPAEVTVRAMRSRSRDGTTPIDLMDSDFSDPIMRIEFEAPNDTGDAMTKALKLAERLSTYLDDELRPYTAEQHRRAIQGLIQRLRAQVHTRDIGSS
jgi:predicted RNA methylase